MPIYQDHGHWVFSKVERELVQAGVGQQGYGPALRICGGANCDARRQGEYPKCPQAVTTATFCHGSIGVAKPDFPKSRISATTGRLLRAVSSSAGSPRSRSPPTRIVPANCLPYGSLTCAGRPPQLAGYIREATCTGGNLYAAQHLVVGFLPALGAAFCVATAGLRGESPAEIAVRYGYFGSHSLSLINPLTSQFNTPVESVA